MKDKAKKRRPCFGEGRSSLFGTPKPGRYLRELARRKRICFCGHFSLHVTVHSRCKRCRWTKISKTDDMNSKIDVTEDWRWAERSLSYSAARDYGRGAICGPRSCEDAVYWLLLEVGEWRRIDGKAQFGHFWYVCTACSGSAEFPRGWLDEKIEEKTKFIPAVTTVEENRMSGSNRSGGGYVDGRMRMVVRSPG